MPYHPRYDSYYGAYEDRRDYLESKGYTYQGYTLSWEPQDPTDLEAELEIPFADISALEEF